MVFDFVFIRFFIYLFLLNVSFFAPETQEYRANQSLKLKSVKYKQ